jgi:hypothetical protein
MSEPAKDDGHDPAHIIVARFERARDEPDDESDDQRTDECKHAVAP